MCSPMQRPPTLAVVIVVGLNGARTSVWCHRIRINWSQAIK